jgi:hypothetical protein
MMHFFDMVQSRYPYSPKRHNKERHLDVTIEPGRDKMRFQGLKDMFLEAI